MTGAGTGTAAYAAEDSFRTLPGTPTWIQPGFDMSIGSASLANALQRSRHQGDPRPAGSREGNLEGALSLSFSLTDDQYHELTFANDAGTGLATEGKLAPTSTWYLEGRLPDGSEARILEGAGVESWTINYQQGEDVTVDLTIVYTAEYDPADADAPTPPIEDDITKPTKSDKVMWHDVDFSLDSTTVEKLQSLSVEVGNMARPRRGQSRYIQDMVVGAYEPSLSFEAILAGTNRRETAYGSIGATTPEDTITEQTATLTLGSLGDYTLSKVQPNSYDWQQLIDSEDTTDPVNAHFTTIEEAV